MVAVVDTGPYGRIIGRVITDGADVNASMARSGFAWYSRKYDTAVQYVQHKQEARRNWRGLWAQDDPVPLWEWRSDSSHEANRALKGALQFIGYLMASIILFAMLISLLG